MRRFFNLLVWSIAIASLLLGGAVAAAFVLMATSLDPLESIGAGIEAWTYALCAAVGFVVLIASTVTGLTAWQSPARKTFGATLLAGQLAATFYACVYLYSEYF